MTTDLAKNLAVFLVVVEEEFDSEHVVDKFGLCRVLKNKTFFN